MRLRYLLGALILAAACATAPSGDRSFRNHVLTSRDTPALTLGIDPVFRQLPTLTFPIEALTDVERYAFIDAEGGVAQRMIIVQFERAQAHSEFRFRYPSRPPRAFGAETYRFGAYVYDDAAAAEQAPDREAARSRALLVAQGYAPPRRWMTARLARVSDPEGLTEVIIFYFENADGRYPPDQPLAGVDEDGDLVLEGEAREALARRMEAVVRPLHG